MLGAFHMSVTKRAINAAIENQETFILEMNAFMPICKGNLMYLRC